MCWLCCSHVLHVWVLECVIYLTSANHLFDAPPPPPFFLYGHISVFASLNTNSCRKCTHVFYLTVCLLVPLISACRMFACKGQEEDSILRVCQNKVRQRSLPMNIVDAEYQFDMHKLTLFFEAER